MLFAWNGAVEMAQPLNEEDLGLCWETVHLFGVTPVALEESESQLDSEFMSLAKFYNWWK